MEHEVDPLLRISDILKLTGLKSKSSIYKLIATDENFPRPLAIGGQTTRFRSSEFAKWLDSLPRKSEH